MFFILCCTHLLNKFLTLGIKIIYFLFSLNRNFRTFVSLNHLMDDNETIHIYNNVYVYDASGVVRIGIEKRQGEG